MRKAIIFVSLLVLVSPVFDAICAAQSKQGKPKARAAKAVKVSQNEIIAQVSIPKIDLDYPVIRGTEETSISRAVGHYNGSAMPGQSGNCVIAAHRHKHFRHLGELKLQDKIYMEVGKITYTYEIVSRKVVLPTDMSVVEPTSDPVLTLITCHPINYIGDAPERLIIKARLVQSADVAGLAQ